MTGSAKYFLKLNLGLLSKSITRHIVLNQVRTLFTDNSLGLVAYQMTRDHYKNKFLVLEESFRVKMKKYVDDDVTGRIFSEDLKVMLHMAEKTPEDIELVIKMLEKYNNQSAKLSFGTYSFGPVVMRLFHRLDEPELALKLFNDPAFGTFFNQLASYQIFMNLLLKNKMYKEVRDVYDIVKQKMADGRVHPRNPLILVTAACYKENSEESMNYALNLWRDLEQRGYPIVRRVITHMAALAIKQGRPDVAIEILMMSQGPRYIGIRCLKIMAYADLDRIDGIIPFLRSSINTADFYMGKEMLFRDTIEKVETAIERTKTSPDSEIVKLLKMVKEAGMVQIQTMDDHIDEPVNVVPRNVQKQRIENAARWSGPRENRTELGLFRKSESQNLA